jgi:hypothetical protein
MFRYPVAILLILLMAAQSFSKWFLIAGFRLNRDYIARNLCINRLNAISCCKGTCFLNKSLTEDENKKQTPGKTGQQHEIVLQVHQPDNQLPEPAVTVITLRHSTRYIHRQAHGYLPSLFAPPRLA